MLKRYLVDLIRRERTELLGLLNKGIAPARTLTGARILLAADEHKTDVQIAEALHVHPATVERTRRRFVEGRAARALYEKLRPGGPAQARSQAGGVPCRARLQQCADR